MIERLTAPATSNGRQSPRCQENDSSDAESSTHSKAGFGPDGGGCGGQILHHNQSVTQAAVPIPPPPRSPLKSVVRAYLPNEQRTIVQVRPGQSVREALSKAMKLRKLEPFMCTVYRCTQPEVTSMLNFPERDFEMRLL